MVIKVPDDFYNPLQPGQDFGSCVGQIQHKLNEYVIDPGSGQLSASRAGFLWMNGIGGVVSIFFAICGVIWNMSWCGIATSGIITALVASDATVYFGSTRKGYRCNCGNERE